MPRCSRAPALPRKSRDAFIVLTTLLLALLASREACAQCGAKKSSCSFGWLLQTAGLSHYDRIVNVFRLRDLAVLMTFNLARSRKPRRGAC